jgi:hypothetical protein
MQARAAPHISCLHAQPYTGNVAGHPEAAVGAQRGLCP